MKKTAKKSLIKAIAMLISIVLLSNFFAPAFAWYINSLSTYVHVEAGIVGSYFEQGNGTADTPYVIARPIQLYYFAWLQNLGYFDGQNGSSTTSDKKFYFTLGADIDMSDNPEYSVLPPIGTPSHPFVGVFDGKYHFAPTDENGDPVTDPFDPNNTKEGQYHVIKNLTISNDDLSNVPVSGGEGMQYVGLFGVIGSITNTAVTGSVKNFGLYRVTVYTKDPTDNKTIVGLVAGYCNGEFEGIGVSDCTVKVKNGVSPIDVTTHQTNADTGEVTTSVVTPETLSFSLVGFSDTTYQAHILSPIAGGDEFGGSLGMDSIYTKLLTVKNDQNSNNFSYYATKVVNIDENGVRTETFDDETELEFHTSAVSSFYYMTENEITSNGAVTESYALVDRLSSYNKLIFSDGNGNYLQAYYTSNSNYGVRNTTDIDSATQWTLGSNINNTTGNTTLSCTIGNTAYYLYYDSSNRIITVNTSSTTWALGSPDSNYEYYTVKPSSATRYITFSNNNWTLATSSTTIKVIRKPGVAVNQYMYLNGGKTVDISQAVTTITRTSYDAYLIQDGDDNYLVGTSSGISSVNNSSNATAWRFSNGASGGTFSIQDENEVTYYLYNNSGTLQVSSSNSTSWTVTNGKISNGGYYLVYLDGAWKLWQETEYFSIGNDNGAYINLSNGMMTGGGSSTTRWHIASGKIYAYNGTTKTYLYNNSGVLSITTNSNTANAWTIDSTNHTISNAGYYLVYLDGAWQMWQETEYYSISNGNGTYLNLLNGTLTSGNSSTTRWHIVGGKIYAYNDTTKTYLYNNSGLLATTTDVNTANTWTVDGTNRNITNAGYYLSYNDSAWGLKQEAGYYLIHDGNSTYLNLSNGDVSTGTSSNATRWFASNDKLYAYNGTTKTYLYNNSGLLATTTNVNTANAWTIDGTNGNITNAGYYLSYNDSAWGLKQEAGYYLIHDGNSHYLNLTNGDVDSGSSSNATRWYMASGKIYAYNGATKTYLYNNAGNLTTTTNVNTANAWTIANNNIKDGSYYLVYQNGWLVTLETDYTLISDGGGNYFNLTNGSFVIGSSSNATRWNVSNGKIYTYVSGTATYLVNSSGALSTTTTSGSATTWTVTSTSITGGDYHLVYQNGWLLTDETGYYLIADNSNHYLNLTSNGIETGTSQTAVGWHFTSGDNGGKIYTYVGGTRTYLLKDGDALSYTATLGDATSWTVSSGQISSGSYYIVYYNEWKVANTSSYYTISDGSGHYLNLTSSGFAVGDSSNATDWQMTSTTSGKIYTYINGTATYLYDNSGTLSTTTNSTTATTWTIDGTYSDISHDDNFIHYDTTWQLTKAKWFKIHDGSSHYLNLTYSNSQALTEVGTSSNATEWCFSDGVNGGYISATANNQTYYLNYVNGNMVPQTTASTSWTISGSKIYCKNSNNDEYDMFYDGACWTIVLSTLASYYIIASGSNYLNCSSGSIANTTVRSYATKWTISSGTSISTNLNGDTKYLYNNSGTLSFGSTITAWTYSTSGTQKTIYIRSGGIFGFGGTYYYVYCNNNGAWTIYSNSRSQTNYRVDNTTSITSPTNSRPANKLVSDNQHGDRTAQYGTGTYNFSNSVSSTDYDLTIDVNQSNSYNLTAKAPYTAYSLTANAPYTAYSLTVDATSTDYNLTAKTTSADYDLVNLTNATTTVWKNTVNSVETTQAKSKDTYIPLSTNDDGSTSLRNTGYIVSGSNYGTGSSYFGDIRVSYYGMGYLYKALGYTSSQISNTITYGTSSHKPMEIVTRTYLSDGFVRISDKYNSGNTSSAINNDLEAFETKSAARDLGLEKYTDSRDQLETMMSGKTSVYGLHFMDAQINASNLVNIGKATINGSTYTNYKMPQDCIDFNLNTKGSLNFYAGTYFSGNKTFFSLHQITRSDGEITAINEIDQIYGDPDNSAKSYIYKYVDVDKPSLPDGYELMFDTSWIKSPTMVEYAMYYFEIPVNAGEYALGSVSGYDGAYLIYLDIGASGKSLADGTTLETSIKGIDFVTYSSLSSASISTTLANITTSTASSAVIILRNRFQGDIAFTIQEVTVDGTTKLRISYVLSDASSKDYVKWTTRASTEVEVVDSTVYT